MEKTLQLIYIFGLHAIFPVEVWSTSCPDGQQCAESHECCPGGCCLPRHPPAYRPPHHMEYFNFSTPMKYYLGMLMSLAVVVLTLAWCCRLRQQAPHWRCWWRPWRCRGTQQRSPDTDSAGSCYYPPQYSRCGSLCRASVQPAPPPYNEVTSKPDLYPMVIYLGPDKGDGDLMVQYFKNYIVRPVGSLSATSTFDSLSSSFLCNTANEANSIIPPPYSCAGSVDWHGGSAAPPPQRQALLRSVSSVTCHEYGHVASPQHIIHHSNSAQLKTSPSSRILISQTANSATGASSPSAQISSENSQILDTMKSSKTMLAHSVSVPNSRLYVANSQNLRGYQDDVNSEVTPEHHLTLPLEGSSPNIQMSIGNENYMKNNYKKYPESRSARVQINKYYNEGSNDSNDENLRMNKKIYTNYVPQEIINIKGKIRNDISDEANQSSLIQEQVYNEEMQQHFNIQSKNRDYSFPDSSCDRNTSAFNLHSLEENNLCSFFSQSIVEGATNENISSDYSNFAKNLNNFGSKDEINRMYSVGGSMTGSDISSLANLGTPDSPPRATSPTSEFKELLDKIHQLPNENEERCQVENMNENASFANDVKEMKSYFSKSRKNSLYMPLNLTPKNFYPGKISPSSNIGFKRQFSRKGWLSRSAPTTPCGSGFVPNILTFSQRSGPSGSGRSSRLSKGDQADGSPLLTEQDASGDEAEQ